MRLPPALFSIALLVPFLGACGAARAGSACNVSDRYACESTTTALECRDSRWRELPCKGTQGCLSTGGQVTCDITGNAAGDACGVGAEGTGICTSDGHALLECRDGTLVQTRVCPTSCSGDDIHLSCT